MENKEDLAAPLVLRMKAEVPQLARNIERGGADRPGRPEYGDPPGGGGRMRGGE